MSHSEDFKINVSHSIGEVSCKLVQPHDSKEIILLAHGAGASMHHRFMKKLSEELALQNISTLRYQFPYMEHGKKRPDKPEVAHATIEAILVYANNRFKDQKIYLGGKSYGGRMSSQFVSKKYPDSVAGLIFYGFPLHPPGKPSMDRSDHLHQIKIPMLFLQGSKDKLAEAHLIKELTNKLEFKTTLEIFEEADHSFQIPKSFDMPYEKMIQNLALSTKRWILGS